MDYKKKALKGVTPVIFAVLGFIFVFGIVIFALGTLNQNINETNTNAFFNALLPKLTATSGVIAAVITIAIISIMFLVIPRLGVGR